MSNGRKRTHNKLHDEIANYLAFYAVASDDYPTEHRYWQYNKRGGYVIANSYPPVGVLKRHGRT